jgi:hypothetical protein
MYLLQSLIIFAVVGSNIYWGAASLGVFLAWLAIVIVLDRIGR